MAPVWTGSRRVCSPLMCYNPKAGGPQAGGFWHLFVFLPGGRRVFSRPG